MSSSFGRVKVHSTPETHKSFSTNVFSLTPSTCCSPPQHLSDEALRSQLLQQGSGKMVLLNKLLPKLRDGGHKVLIFSQVRPPSIQTIRELPRSARTRYLSA